MNNFKSIISNTCLVRTLKYC